MPYHATTNRSRWTVLNNFVDHVLPLLPKGASVAAYIGLYRHANKQNQVAMGASRLADLLGVDRRTAQRALQDLLDAGAIKIIRRGGIHNGCNTYQL
jgi:DNA-binding MarR family transcriptional regulator